MCDVVFIHGIGGDRKGTWRFGSPDSKPPGYFWPSYLDSTFPECRVHLVDYNSKLSKLTGGPSMSLADISVGLLDDFANHGIGKRPIIFVVHSMGGILLKKFMRVASNYGSRDYKAICDMVVGILFLATPHSGSNLAALAKKLSLVFRPTETLMGLGFADAELRELQTWFLNQHVVQRFRVKTYAENRPVAKIGGLVVDQVSANPGIPGAEFTVLDDEDHISISKPESSGFQVVLGAKRYIENVLAFWDAAENVFEGNGKSPSMLDFSVRGERTLKVTLLFECEATANSDEKVKSIVQWLFQLLQEGA
jgi:hypothetical protein